MMGIMVLSLPTKAEYYLKSNTSLEMCHEFTAYLNRKPDHYYRYDLKPDSVFKYFKLLTMEKLDKKEWFERYRNIYFSNRQKFIDDSVESYKKRGRSFDTEDITSRMHKTWETLENKFWTDEVELYLDEVDINHNGKIDKIMIYSSSSNSTHKNHNKLNDYSKSHRVKTKSYVFYAIDRIGIYDLEKNASDGGHFFYYKGRFYVASISVSGGVFIYEPKKPSARDGRFYWSGMGVCDIDMKR